MQVITGLKAGIMANDNAIDGQVKDWYRGTKIPVMTGLRTGIGANDNASDNGVKGWYNGK